MIFNRTFLNSNENVYPFAENFNKFVQKKIEFVKEENITQSFKTFGNPGISY